MALVQKLLWLTLALVFLVLAIVGLLLPVIPQVPFFFGAAWSLTKASTRFKKWLHSHRWYHQTVKQLPVWKRQWAKKADVMLRHFQINWQWLTRQWQVEAIPIEDEHSQH